jgi:DNA recombination protein RmuC
MTETYLLIALLLLNIGIIVALIRRKASVDMEALRPLVDGLSAETRRVETSLRDEFTRQRGETSRDAQALREEVNARLREFGDSNDTRFTRLRSELNDGAGQARTEMRQGFVDFRTAVQTALNDAASGQGNQLKDFSTRLEKLNDVLAQQLDKVRATMEGKLAELQLKNEQKLEEMRKTVDEKLQGTLERRLGESFKIVSERLEQVHKGLGEMQSMASSVGDLKRVLTNVKTRGTWGEIQLGALLEQILTQGQYEANVAPKPNSGERVEFAIRLPGKDGADHPIWLPIDAKFPQEDYQRLLEASEAGNADRIAETGRALENRLRSQAKDIRDKYVSPPHTTDFAILFLPSEGLYAEALRRPGLWDRIQADYRVVIAGPTTIAALLNSLQMGFKTLAIQERSSEVWRVLAGVKKEFDKFGEVLAKVKKKIEEAGSHIEATEVRTRAINKQLRAVEAPSESTPPLIPDGMPLSDDELADSVEATVAAERALFERQFRLDK